MIRPWFGSFPSDVDLANAVHALDATTIDLCLSVFSSVPIQNFKDAVTLHTLFDLLVCDELLPDLLNLCIIISGRWEESS